MKQKARTVPKRGNQLKPCPFCGGHDIRPNTVQLEEPGDFFYQCHDCTTTGPNGSDWESATLQWNDRRQPEPEEPQKEIVKERPCLRCGKLTRTTPERRICPGCHNSIKVCGMDTGYEPARGIK